MVDPLDIAIHAESKARAALIAAGEHLGVARDQPTEEELCLHAHLVRQWQRRAEEVMTRLNDSLAQSPALSTAPEG